MHANHTSSDRLQESDKNDTLIPSLKSSPSGDINQDQPPGPDVNMLCQICKEYHIVKSGCCCVNDHFVCWEGCFNEYVKSALKVGAIHSSTDKEGNLLCPSCKAPYDLQAACSQGAPSDVFNGLQELRISVLIERRVKDALEMAERKRRAEEARIAAIGDKIEQDAERLRMKIVNDVLTLCCPRVSCRAAFTDFDGCFALTCWACRCSFCAWCLKDCGADAHNHVTRCVENQSNRSVFSTKTSFDVHHLQRRKAAVLRLLADQTVEVQDRVKHLMRRDLADLGIALGAQPTEAPKRFQPPPLPQHNDDPNRNNRRNNRNERNNHHNHNDRNRNQGNNHNVPHVAAPPPAQRYREPPRPMRRLVPQVPQDDVPYYEQPRRPLPLARRAPQRNFDKNNPFSYIVPIVVCVVLGLGQYYCGLMSTIAILLYHFAVWSARVWYFILSNALYYGFWGTNNTLIAFGHMLYWSTIAVSYIAFYVGSAICSMFLLFFS